MRAEGGEEVFVAYAEVQPIALRTDLRLAPDLQARTLEMKDGKDLVAGGAPPKPECVDAVREEVFASSGDDLGFALWRCQHEAAAHAVAAEDPSRGPAGEEQLFGVDDADQLALLV